MTNVPTSIIERIQKLLTLTQSSNPNEAASAAAKAAELMRKHEISEAMLSVSGGASETITEGQIAGTQRAGKRVTWKGAISGGVAKAYGVIEWWKGGAIMGIGRTSAVQTWQYTCQYLYREVERLADEGWEPQRLAFASWDAPSARSWENAFRVGAAVVISKRLREQHEASEACRRVSVEVAVCEQAEQSVGNAATTSTALAVIDRIDRDRAEVEQAFKARSAHFGRNPQRTVTVASSDGYPAGAAIELNRTGPALAAPAKQIKE